MGKKILKINIPEFAAYYLYFRPSRITSELNICAQEYKLTPPKGRVICKGIWSI